MSISTCPTGTPPAACCLLSASYSIANPVICNDICSATPTAKNQCNSIYATYCGTGSNITSASCSGFISWAKTNSLDTSAYDTAWTNYCTANNTNLTSTPCYNFYTSNYNNTNIAPQFGTAWNDYCLSTAGHADPKCACIVSPYECAIQMDPKCSASTAVTTQNQRTMQCPSITNCVQYVNVAPGSTTIDQQIHQDCIRAGQIPVSATPVTPATPATPVTPATPTSGSPNVSLTVIIFILVFILIVIISIVAVLHFSHKSRGQFRPVNY
jgi:hypothetical protein